eukprot:12284423-Karenia_brevis.AAC.1
MAGRVEAPSWVDKPQVNLDGGVIKDACIREEDDEDEDDEVCSIQSLEEASDHENEIVCPVDEGSDDED